jgi:UDP-3-O-[3-hydroxymyristoyl] glucosamine N-acyltransferase
LELKVRDIADRLSGHVAGDDQVVINGVNALDKAADGDISFFFDTRYKGNIKESKASALVVPEKIEAFKGPQVIVPNPKLAYAMLVAIFAPPMKRFPGISNNAVISDTASLGENISVYPMVYIGENAVIDNDVTLYPGVFIGDNVKIGQGTVLYPNVTVMHECIIGKDVIIHAGTVVGSDGFGYARDGSSNVKIPQLGNVVIDDDVEIGSNSAIDRAAMGKTWIQRGVKIDNFVQVAHNVAIGEDTVIVAQTGISGSTNIGREVIMSGRVGISDHLDIGDRAILGPGSGVIKSVPPGEVVTGYPAVPHRTWLKTSGLVSRLPQIRDKIREMEKKIEALEKLIQSR